MNLQSINWLGHEISGATCQASSQCVLLTHPGCQGKEFCFDFFCKPISV